MSIWKNFYYQGVDPDSLQGPALPARFGIAYKMSHPDALKKKNPARTSIFFK